MGAKSYKEDALKVDVFYQHNAYIKPARRAFMHSLKKTKSFKIVYEQGKRIANHFFVVHVKPNDLLINQLGITVSKKVGNAVVRNKIKRIIKESCRHKTTCLKKGFDIVVVIRPVVGTLQHGGLYKKMDKTLDDAFIKLGIMLKK